MGKTDKERPYKVNMTNFDGCTDNGHMKQKIPAYNEVAATICPTKANETQVDCNSNIESKSYTTAIAEWIKSTSNAEEDAGIVEAWISSYSSTLNPSMDDAIDSFLTFAEHLYVYCLSDIYI